MTRLSLVSCFLFLMAACTGVPFWRTERRLESAETGEARAELELQNVQYDGETLSGRLLIGAVSGRLLLDKRLIVNTVVNLDIVRECETGLPPTFMRADAFPRPAREEDLLALEPGHWYGKQIHIPLFSAALGHPGPDCIEATLTFHTVGDKRAGHLTVRATRPPQASEDAGQPPEPLPSTDGGTPEAPSSSLAL
jgi:hypothetical protein